MNGFSSDDFVARQKKLKDFSSLLNNLSTCPGEQWDALFQKQKDLLSDLRQFAGSFMELDANDLVLAPQKTVLPKVS